MSPDDEKAPDFTVHDPGKGGPRELPRIDFSTFVLSLAASAMVHLGRAPEPESGQPREKTPVDLAMARQTIDTLEMVRDKTRGNLAEDEEKLLQTVLYELRMAFVQAQD